MKTIFNRTVILCFCFFAALSSLSAQQFKLTATPNSAYALENIYDLNNTTTGNIAPVGLVRHQANIVGLFGTTLQHYNNVTGAINNPVFNYILPAGNIRNLRGAKFVQTLNSYTMVGTTDEVSAAGAIRPHLFLTRVNSANGVVAASRRVVLPTTFTRPVVSNIITTDNQRVHVSGTVYVGTQQHIFAFFADANFNILWFRIYRLSFTRDFTTFAQCLVNNGNQLILAGIDQKTRRAIVYRINPANGVLVAVPASFGLCVNNVCRDLNYVSIGRSGNWPDIVVQSTQNTAGNVLFNVSQLNATWSGVVAGTTYNTPKWNIKSVRFENQGVLISHQDQSSLRYTRSRYNGGTGIAIAGTSFTYTPPATDQLGIAPQIETITLPNNRVFSVGKYRDLPSNGTRTLVELQPSLCQSAFGLQPAQERLNVRPDSVQAIIQSIQSVPMPVIQVALPTNPLQICAAAANADGVGDRSETPETTEEIAGISTLRTYPNPFGTSMRVAVSEGGVSAVQMFDMTGKAVQEWQFDGQVPEVAIEMPAGVLNGLYLLRVKDSSNQWHYKKVTKNE
jgi:hypothetical protein